MVVVIDVVVVVIVVVSAFVKIDGREMNVQKVNSLILSCRA